jgi:hypothetical protein
MYSEHYLAWFVYKNYRAEGKELSAEGVQAILIQSIK